MRFLFVDDQLDMLDIYESFLDQNIHSAKYASDPEEALELCRKLKFDTMVTDLKMPKMDGITLAKEVNKIYEIPIILVTSFATKDDLEKFKREVSYLSILIKPDCFDSLNREIRKVKAYIERRNKDAV